MSAALLKRTAGAPLTEAEHQQRIDAARSRWSDGRSIAAAAGGAAVGGMIGHKLVARAVSNVKRRALDALDAAVEPVNRFQARKAQMEARHAAAAASIDKQLRAQSKFLPAAIRSMRSMTRQERKALAEHMARHAEPFWIEPGEPPVMASTDAVGERALRENAAALAARTQDLIDNVKKPGKKVIPGRINVARVESFESPMRGPRTAQWHNPAAVEEWIKADPEHFASHGIESMKDLERRFLETPVQYHGHLALELGVRRPKMGRPRIARTITNSTRFIPEHTQPVEGYPPKAGRAEIAGQIRSNIKDRQRAWWDRTMPGQEARVKVARSLARWNARDALKDLKWAQGAGGARARIAGSLLGAAAGAGLAYLAARAIRDRQAKSAARSRQNLPGPLTKAAPPDTAKQIFDAGVGVEDDLASRLASTLQGLGDLPTNDLIAGGPDLRGRIAERIGRASKPLDTAVQGGAGAQTPVSTVTAAGTPKLITYSLDVRNPAVTEFMQANRLKLAGNMADEQMQTIKAVLLDAARMGQPPATTARILRQTVGLTPNQAAQVISYRRQLETLDPRAQQRALHDKRFDRTIDRAIATNAPLTEDQVNRMTDNYQARYIALRATTIARTEGVGAANNGHVEAVRSFLEGNPEFTVIKTWVSTEDGRTRPDHIGLDGKSVVGLDTPFQTASGDQILWPHDPDAAARQVVNCRCTMATQIVSRASAALHGTDAAQFPTVPDDQPVMENA